MTACVAHGFMVVPLQMQRPVHDHMRPMRRGRLALLARLALDDLGANHEVTER